MIRHSIFRRRSVGLAFFVVATAGITAESSFVDFNSRSAAPFGSGLVCPTTNATADTTIRGLKNAMVGTDGADSSFRTGLGIVGLDSSALVVVTDSLVCTRVTQVLDSVFHYATASTVSPFVVKVGARYIAFPDLPVSRPKFILDTNYVFLGSTPY
jgi:hypothetical protein